MAQITPSDLVLLFAVAVMAIMAVIAVASLILLWIVDIQDAKIEKARLDNHSSLMARFNRLHAKEANDRAEWLRIQGN